MATRLYADIPELLEEFRIVHVNDERIVKARVLSEGERISLNGEEPEEVRGQLVHVTLNTGEQKLFVAWRKPEKVELRNPIRKATASMTRNKQAKGVLRPGKTARKRRREEEARKRLREQEEKAQKAEKPKKEEKAEPVKVFISLMGCGCIVERANDPICVQHDNSEVIDQEEAK